MRIGVVLCTYNGERFLRAQLDSICAQSRVPDEMLLQDDGSSDKTIEIAESWAARAPFPVRILRNHPNLGFVRNFEQGILRCDADIIALSDQDDYWRADKLQKIEQVFASDEGASAVFSDAEMVDENLRPLGYGLLHALNVTPRELGYAQRGDLLPVLLRRNIVSGATMTIRGNQKHRWLPIPDGAYHDEWIALVAAAFGELRYWPEPLNRYRQHPTNQLGVPITSKLQRLRRVLLPTQTEDLRKLKVVENLTQRLMRLQAPSHIAGQVSGKLQHLRARTSLPSPRFSRLTSVLRELLCGRYSRYSSGLRSAVRDLVRR